jgi:hypothetical protein
LNTRQHLKLLHEIAWGKKLAIAADHGRRLYKSLLSLNTKPGEREYRLSLFSPDGQPLQPHVDLDANEVEEVTAKHIPSRLSLALAKITGLADFSIL